METIPIDSIEEVERTLFAYTQQEMSDLMKRFQKKQTPLLVYLAAISEREELTEDEQDVLFSQALVTWQLVAKHSRSVTKISMKALEHSDVQLLPKLESLASGQDMKQVEDVIDKHEQPVLLRHLWSRVLTPDPNEIRPELRVWMFLVLVMITDLLMEASR